MVSPLVDDAIIAVRVAMFVVAAAAAVLESDRGMGVGWMGEGNG